MLTYSYSHHPIHIILAFCIPKSYQPVPLQRRLPHPKITRRLKTPDDVPNNALFHRVYVFLDTLVDLCTEARHAGRGIHHFSDETPVLFSDIVSGLLESIFPLLHHNRKNVIDGDALYLLPIEGVQILNAERDPR